MKSYLAVAVFSLSLFACEADRSTEPVIFDGQQSRGTFVITYNEGTSQQYSEQGTVVFVFRSGSYSYTGTFADTTLGRGQLFRFGIGDHGKYSLDNNFLNMHDRALDIGTMNPIGVPSLYLGGQFQVLRNGRTIVITQRQTNRSTVLTLSR